MSCRPVREMIGRVLLEGLARNARHHSRKQIPVVVADLEALRRIGSQVRPAR